MTASKKILDPKGIENELGVKLPSRLKKFYSSGEYNKYEGKYVYGIGIWPAGTKFKIKILKRFSRILESNDIKIEEQKGKYILPFATFGDVSNFVGVDLSDVNCPVFFWEGTKGFFEPFTDTLDEFLARLLSKGEQPPVIRLHNAVLAASKLIDKDRNGEALDRLLKAAEGITVQAIKDKRGLGYQEHQLREFLGDYYNLRGTCYKNLGKAKLAYSDFESGVVCGSMRCRLNIMDLHIDAGEYKIAEKVAKSLKGKYLDGYEKFYLIFYLGKLAVLTRNATKGQRNFRTIKKYYSDSPDLKFCIEFLRNQSMKETASGKIAKETLKWFNKT